MGGSSQKPDSFPSTLHNFMCKNSCAPCHIFIANQFIISLLNSNISTQLRSDYQPCWWKYRNLYIQQPRLVVVMTVCKIWCTECNQGIRCYRNPDNTRNHMYKMCDWNSIRRIYVQTDTLTNSRIHTNPGSQGYVRHQQLNCSVQTCCNVLYKNHLPCA